MDGDKALEKTAIITLWKKVLQTAQIFIKNFFFLFYKDPNKTTQLPAFGPWPHHCVTLGR